MTRRLCLWVVILLVIATPARAQWVVVDPGNIAQAVLIAQRTLQQYQLAMQMAQSLQNVANYRLGPLGNPLVIPRAAVQQVPIVPRAAGAVGAQHAALLDQDTRLTAILGQAARVAAFNQALAGRLQRLEADVTAPGQHSTTAVMDAIAVGELLGRQQAAAAQATAEAQLDLQTAQELRMREDQANLLRFRMELLTAPPLQSGVAGLAMWRQP